MPVPIWAGHYIGLPFKSQGRDRAGVDCWGLVRLALAEQFGLALPSFAREYQRTLDAARIPALIERETPLWRAVSSGEEKQGDVIVLRVRGRPMHVGLVLGDGQMLHVELGIDSAIERYDGPQWRERIFGFYRYKRHDEPDPLQTDAAIG
ncbi:MAG: phage tail protein [Alphaproteobacteria bacterium]|nr:phage tail protein [Alphaproteobacteria bacterium]